MAPATCLRFGSRNPDLLAGWVEAQGVLVEEAPPALAALLDALLEERRGADFPPEATRKAVRDLLRHGGFKPTGRNKPASEYLARAAAEGRFPRINNVVDVGNHVSLLTGFPVSLFDLDAALAGAAGLVLREARPGESYVFNPSGQEIDLEGLVCVAREGGAPIANAVKDCMATKTGPGTRSVLAVLYASRRVVDAGEVEAMARTLGAMLGEHAGAASVAVGVLPA